VSQRRHDGKVAVDTSNTRWCSDGFELSSDNGERVLVKTIKRDYASLAARTDAATVMQQLGSWFEHYNTKHPHSALNYMPPRRFRGKQALA
jgi:transposase InsO family protein